MTTELFVNSETRAPDSANAGGERALSSIDWEAEARQAIRALLARKGCSYKALARRFEDGGIQTSARVLSNRVARGGFSFAFVMQIAHALGVERIDVQPASVSRKPMSSQGDEP